jgi:PEP-CTERM motif-containing protein
MKVIGRRKGVIFILVCAFAFCVPAFADTMLDVSIDTSGVSRTAGGIAFDFVTNNPGSGNDVAILNFSAPGGTLDLPQTQGGLVSGDIILGLNPAPFTVIESNFFFNELLVPFTSFGNSIAFSLDIGGIGPAGGLPPDEFNLFLLNSAGLPLFPTLDPLLADSLIRVDVTGVLGGVVNVYSPATLSGASVQIPVPGGSTPVPEPSSVLLLTSGLASLVGLRWKCRKRCGFGQ